MNFLLDTDPVFIFIFFVCGGGFWRFFPIILEADWPAIHSNKWVVS